MEDEENDLLTLELRVMREGVLDRDAALAVIRKLRDAYDRGYDFGYYVGYQVGHDNASTDVPL